MPRKPAILPLTTLASLTKRCYFAGRETMEAELRPFGISSTQWHVLNQLSQHDTVMQGDLQRTLHVERAILSGVVGTLVRGGLVEQTTSNVDLRQKTLRMTRPGRALWSSLPDLTFIHELAFGGLSEADVLTAIRVLQTATDQLLRHNTDRKNA